MKYKKILLVVVAIVVALLVANKYFSSYPPNENIIWGASFDTNYARFLGLNPDDVYKTILDDWNFRHLRLSARWDQVEQERGKFNFSEQDYLMDEAAKRDAKVVLVVGQKTPRWPECNVPEWSKVLTDTEYFNALNNYIKVTTEHFAKHPALEIWQVENEPFFPFGEKCRSLNSVKLQNEIATVRSVDTTHPTLVTDSGELSTWYRTATAGDIFGSTFYRVVWNKYLGYMVYDWLPPWYYRIHILMYKNNLSTAYISELQAEPWVANHAISVNNVSEQLISMNLDRLQKHLEVAKQTGFARAYLWGAEWWYWLRVHGYSDIADYIKNLKKS